MAVNIGDFCIQDNAISKVIREDRGGLGNIAYYFDHMAASWFINLECNTPLTIQEFLKTINDKDNYFFRWPKRDDKNIEFLRDAFLYAVKNSYGIDLTK